MSVNIPLGILQRISEFLADLPEDQLTDLAEGRAGIAYVPFGAGPVPPRKPATAKKAVAPKAPALDAVATIDHLRTLSTREAVLDELAPFKTKATLVELAKVLSVPSPSKLSIDDLRAEIVEATVGRRLDSIAIRGFDGLRP